MTIYWKNNNFDTAKACQQSDIPTKIQDYFAGYFCGNINQCISKLMFPPDLRLADVTPVHKNKSKTSKDDYRPLSILSNYQKFMKDVFMIKFRFSPIIFCPNISAGFKEATMHNTAW